MAGKNFISDRIKATAEYARTILERKSNEQRKEKEIIEESARDLANLKKAIDVGVSIEEVVKSKYSALIKIINSNKELHDVQAWDHQDYLDKKKWREGWINVYNSEEKERTIIYKMNNWKYQVEQISYAYSYDDPITEVWDLNPTQAYEILCKIERVVDTRRREAEKTKNHIVKDILKKL